MPGRSGRGNAQVGAPLRGHEASSRAAQGRVCDQLGCSTILSTYNATGTCWLHTTPAYRHPLAQA